MQQAILRGQLPINLSLRKAKGRKVQHPQRKVDATIISASENKHWSQNNITNALVFSFMAVLFAVSSYYVITHVGLHSDEGFYVMAAKKAMSGEIPYRDFGYTQTPLLPYINGLLMAIFGFGEMEHRLINAFWGLSALIVSMAIVYKRSNIVASFICGWVLVTTPWWVMASPFSPYGASFFFMALVGLLICSKLPFNKKAVLFSLFGTLSIACRLTILPSIIVLWIYMISQGSNNKERAIAVSSFIAAVLIVFLPFFCLSPENFIFWNLGYHLGSSLSRRFISEHIFTLASVLLITLSGMLAAATLEKKWRSPEFMLLVAASVGILSQVALKANYGIYSMPFAPLCAIGGSIILSEFEWRKYVCLALVFFPALYFTSYSPLNYLPIPISAGMDKGWVSTLNDAEGFIREHTHSHGYILTPYPILAVHADRNVFNGMEMGMFGVTDEIDIHRAEKLHLMPYDEVIKIVEARRAEAVILRYPTGTWDFLWSVPSITLVAIEKRRSFVKALKENYTIGLVEPPLVILLPRR